MEKKTPQDVVFQIVPFPNGVSEKEEPPKSWKFLLVCLIWLISSISDMFLSKYFYFPVKTTILVVQLISMSLYTWIFTVACDIPNKNTNVSWLNFLKYIVPVAVSICGRIMTVNDRLWTTPISDPYSAEADFCTPFFVLLLSKFILANNKIEYWQMSLAMLTAWLLINLRNWIFMYNPQWISESMGYALLTAIELTFSKEIMQQTGIHPLRLLIALSSLILLVILPKWIYEMFWCIEPTSLKFISNWEFISCILLLGALGSVQAASAFTILSMVSLERYVIGSICNRIIRICSYPFTTIIFGAANGWRDYDGESQIF
ncbi:solute carrier family 35 member E1 homolog [Venturia canescens]|uniref:solute carrier family 35 member E1 homolog n=1 Tax=Venturia canescens TaxID=32260 RepID=UPI001C9C44B3|nr:solute carrier family 35 member E1 homolog [Venturia canescens]